MTFAQLKKHFGGKKNRVAMALGVSRQAVQRWEEEDRVPDLRQIQAQEMTQGKLKRSIRAF